MRSLSKVVTTALALVGVAFGAAGCKEEVVYPIEVTATVVPDAILNDGVDTATLTITATDEKKQPAVGDVTLVSNAGFFNGSDRVGRGLVSLVNGTATTTFTCSKAKSPGCQDKVVIEVNYGGVATNVTVKITDLAAPRVTLVADKTDLVAGLDSDKAQLTVTVKREGKALADQAVLLKASAGEFKDGLGDTIELTTDETGTAQATYLPGTVTDPKVTITAAAADVSATPLTLTLSKPTLKVTAAKPYEYAGVGLFALVDLQLQSAAGTDLRLATGLEVTTTQGTIDGTTPAAKTATVTTDENGKAQARIALNGIVFGTTSKVAAEVTGSVLSKKQGEPPLGTGKGTFDIRQVRTTIAVEQNKTSIFSGVGDSANLTVQLKDATDDANLPVADVALSVEVVSAAGQTSATLHQGTGTASTPLAVTTSNLGKADVVLTAPGLEQQEVSIVARLATADEKTIKVQLKKPTLKLTAASTALIGTIGTVTELTAQLTDGATPPKDLQFKNVEVTFTNRTEPFGAFVDATGTALGASTKVSTGDTGAARVRYQSLANNAAEVQAEVAAALGSETPVALKLPIAPLEATLESLGSLTLFNGVGETSMVKAVLKSGGVPQAKADVTVRFQAPLTGTHGFVEGTALKTYVDVKTDVNGVATALFAPSTSDSANPVAVSAILPSTKASNPVTFKIEKPNLVPATTSDVLVTAIGTKKTYEFQLSRDLTRANAYKKSGVDVLFELKKAGAAGGAPTTAALMSGTSKVASVTGTTNADGIATVTFDTGSTVEDLVLSASAAGINPGSIALSLKAATVRVAATNSKQIVYKGLNDSLEIVADLLDGSTPVVVPDTEIVFETPSHKLKDGANLGTRLTVRTGTDGKARVSFVPQVAELAGKVNVTASLTNAPAGSPKPAYEVTVKQPKLAVTANPTTLPVAVGDTSVLTARIVDDAGAAITTGAPLDGVTLTFNLLTSPRPDSTGFVSAGLPRTLSASIQAVTNTSGVATATFDPGTLTTATAGIEATADGITGLTGASALAIALQPVIVEMPASAGSVLNGVGDSTSVVGALYAVSGTGPTQIKTPLARAGVSVVFETDNHFLGASLKQVTATTGATGTASVTFTPDPASAAAAGNIKAWVTGLTKPTTSSYAVAVTKPTLVPLASTDTAVTGVGARKDYGFQLTRDGTLATALSNAGVDVRFTLSKSDGSACSAKLVDPVSGALVSTLLAKTNTSGIATVKVDTGSAVEMLKLVATAAGINLGQMSIDLKAATIRLTTTGNKGSAYKGLGDYVELVGELLDNNSAPIVFQGADVTFETASHRLVAGTTTATKVTVQTNAQGKALARFVPQPADAAGAVVVSAGLGTAPTTKVTQSITVLQPKLVFTAAPATIPVAVGDTSTITAKIVDANGNPITSTPVTGFDVTFRVTTNPLPEGAGFVTLANPRTVAPSFVVQTGAGGTATASFDPGTLTTASAAIELAADGITGTNGAVTLLPVAIALTPIAPSVFNGVGETLALQGQIESINGTVRTALARPGVTVNFETLQHKFSTGAKTATAVTGATGAATVTLSPDPTDASTSAAIIAYVNGTPRPATSTYSVAVRSPVLMPPLTSDSMITAIGGRRTYTFQLTRDGNVANPLAKANVDVRFAVTKPDGSACGASLVDPANGALVSSLTVKTAAEGTATVTFATGVNVEDVKLSATAAAIVGNAMTIRLSAATILLTAAKPTAYKGLRDTVELSAQLMDGPTAVTAQNVDITFESLTQHKLQSGAVLSTRQTVKTNAGGKALVQFVPASSEPAGVAKVRAGLGVSPTAFVEVPVTVKQPQLVFAAALPALPAGVGDTAEIKVNVVDDTGGTITGLALNDVSVMFRVTNSPLPTGTGFVNETPPQSWFPMLPVLTGATGSASATFDPGPLSGAATLEVSADGMTGKTGTITLVPVAVALSTSAPSVFNGVGDTLPVKGELQTINGTTRTPIARKNVGLTFETSAHRFDNGATTTTAVTDLTGAATAAFKPLETEAATQASITAYVTALGKTNPVPVPLIVSVQKPAIVAKLAADTLVTNVGRRMSYSFQLMRDKTSGASLPRAGVPVTFAVAKSGGGTTGAKVLDPATGTLATSAVIPTNAMGTATVTFDTGAYVEDVILTASAPAVDAGTMTIKLIQATVGLLPPSKTTAFNGLGDSISLTAQVYDSTTGAPLAVKDTDITVGTTAHKLEAVAGLDVQHTLKTNAQGQVTFKLVPQPADLASAVTIKAALGSSIGTTFVQQALTVKRPKLLFVGGLPSLPTAVGDTVKVKAQIVEDPGNLPIGDATLVNGVGLLFQVKNGLLPPTGFLTSAVPPAPVTSLQVTTDSTGTAEVTFSPGSSAQSADLEASASGITSASGTLTIRQVAVDLTASTNLTYNGIDASLDVTGQLVQISGTTRSALARPNVDVTIETTTHLVSNGVDAPAKVIVARTDAAGLVRFKFLPSVAATENAAKLTAYVTSTNKVPAPVAFDVAIQTPSITVTALPTTLTSGIGQESTITAQLKSGAANVNIAGIALTFTTDVGGFKTATGMTKSIVVPTTSDGSAVATFVTGDETGTANVTVSRSVLAQGKVTLTLNGVGINLSASLLKLYMNIAGEQSTLTAQLTNNGQPTNTAGVNVTFTTPAHNLRTLDGATTARTITVPTDSSGRAAVLFITDTTDTSPSASITATANGKSSVPVAIQVVKPAIAMLATPATLTTGISQTGTVTAQLRDGQADLKRAGVVLVFKTDRGQLQSGAVTASELTATTDTQGLATVTFVAGDVPGTATVTGSRDGFTSGSTQVTLQPVNVAITMAKSVMYTGVGQSANGTVDVKAGTTPLANKSVTVTVATAGAGTLLPGSNATGAGTASVSLTTDGDGKAYFTFTAANLAGAATLNASCAGGTGTATVQIKAIDQIVFLGPTPVMGITGSGVNETAQLQFKVLSGGVAVGAGLPVSFALTTSTPATLLTTVEATDAQGIATATVRSGKTIGFVRVRATCATQSVETPDISVRYNRPSAGRMVFTCDRMNLDVYNTDVPPKVITVPCSVKLNERDGSGLQVPTKITFISEAGSHPAEVMLPSNGVATFNFSTGAGAPQHPVSGGLIREQLAIMDGTTPVIAYQPPEPGTPSNHPRARYVTFVAYSYGEEEFSDVNNNGQWDAGELFGDVARKNGVYDRAEPFADANGDGIRQTTEKFLDVNADGAWNDAEVVVGDANGNGAIDPGEFIDTDRKNGVWDAGETYTEADGNGAWTPPEPLVDIGEPYADFNDNGWWDKGEPYQDINNDGYWNPPNGGWDQVTGIWFPVWFVYTGTPRPSMKPTLTSPLVSPLPVAMGATEYLAISFLDDFFNVPATSSTFTVSRTGNRGGFAVTWNDLVVNGNAASATVRDGFGGGGPKRSKIGLRLGNSCIGATAREPVCIWKTHFESWPEPLVGTIRLTGGSGTPTPELSTFTVSGTTNGTNTAASWQVQFQ